MINDTKELEKLLKLCRKQGVVELEWNGVRFKLGDLPVDPSKSSDTPEESPSNPYANFPMGELTPDQLAFYSAGGVPENDPILKAGQN